MARKKRDPTDLDLPMGPFRIRPEWYEEYWLTPEKEPPAGRRWPRWNAAVYAGVAAAVFSLMVVVFVVH